MPAVRLLLPYMAGIATCIGVDNFILLFSVLEVICIVMLIYINLQKSVASVYKYRYISGMAVSIAMLSSGYMVTFFHTDCLDPHHIGSAQNDPAVYVGVIADPVVIKDKTVSALIDLKETVDAGSPENATGKILALIIKDDKSQALRYGDEIIFTGDIKAFEEPKNPNQFDYKEYQALHHIYERAYLKPGEWKVVGTGRGNPILAKIYEVRAYFLSLIKQEVPGANELAVATAIMLGYRDYVTYDVTQAYAGSGVLHVLSVSGLHVAVLYFVLSTLLGWMDRRRKLQVVKGVLVIVIMLFYAGLTGLSPPVLRSVWMFTLITIARLLDRDVSMYNVLGVSCLLLLIWDPYYIADVGFQLSYIAVAGIVYLYPMLHGIIADTDILHTKNKWIDFPVNWLTRWTWGLICVSIAAQLVTFPVGLFYFHTFPNFFLLSNLLVIPLSNFVLIAGMLLFVVGWSEKLLSIVGWVFDHLLIVLNKVVFSIDALPFSLSKGVFITGFEMILLYIVLVVLLWYLADRRAKVLIASLSLVCILCTAFSIREIKAQDKKELVVYHVSNRKAIAVIDHGMVYYDFDSTLIHDEIAMRYEVKDHWYASGVRGRSPMDSMKGMCMLPFGKICEVHGKRIVIIDGKVPSRETALQKLKADVVILSEGADVNVKDLVSRISFSQVVFDTSNKSWMTKRWKAECDALNVKYHDCRSKAFVMEM